MSLSCHAMRGLASVCLALSVGLPFAAPASRAAASPKPYPADFDSTDHPRLDKDYNLLADLVEIGARVSYATLLERTRREYDAAGKFTGGFLGSIDRLETDPGFIPTLYANLAFNDDIGIETSWQDLGVRTYTHSSDHHTDGRFRLYGPSLLLWLRCRNSSVVTPRLGLGAVFLRTDFAEDPAWRIGFSPAAYREWLDAGSPGGKWPNYGFVQTIDTSNATGFMIAAGCEARLRSRIHADIDVRYVAVEVNSHYYMSQYGKVTDDRGVTAFPMNTLYVAVGMRYDF